MSASSERQERKKALIISVSKYKNLQTLDFCENNGIALYRYLKSLDYEIPAKNKLIGEVKWVNFRDRIVDFFTDVAVRPKDTLIFYFSGHGVPGINGDDLYLATSELDPNNPLRKGFSFEEAARIINMSLSKRIIIILDCCHSGAANLAGSVSMGDENASARLGRAAIDKNSKILEQGEGRCLLSSSSPAQQSYGLKQSGHSIFSYYLLEGLRGANGESIDKLGHVTPDTLGDYVFEKVVENVPNQRPIKKVIMTGNIVLANHRELLRNTQFDSQVDPILKIETKEKPTVTKLRRKKKPGIKPDRWKFLNYWRQKGNRLYKQGQYQKAIEAYTMILRSPSKDSLVLNNMGNCLAYLSRFEAAIEYYDKALKISPYDDYILGNKGWALDGLGKHDEAIEYYDKAVKINPINDMALAYKGAALGGLGKHDEAIEYYDKALKINPENELALTYTGLSLTILGKHDEAIEYYDKALKINPENELALDNKNQALVKTPQWKRFFRLRKKPTS